MLWNVTGVVLPLAVALPAIPAIMRHLGVVKFGILSVIWMLIGYFSIFDLGLSRALTKVVAERMGSEGERDVPAFVATTLVLVSVVIVPVSVLLALLSGVVVHRLFDVPPGVAADTVISLRWLAVSLPFVLGAAVLFGALEGLQEFALTNSVRLPLGVLLFVVSYGVSCVSRKLSVITAALAGLRVMVFVALAILTWWRLRRVQRAPRLFRFDQVRHLFVFGGWLTVSNVVGPLLVYLDRFMIVGMIGVAAVAYYTVPMDALFRVLYLPGAIQGVLFPVFANLQQQSPEAVVSLFRKSSTHIFLVVVPVTVGVILLGQEGLRLWMGGAFAARSYVVAEWLAVGILCNAAARTPIMLVQSWGRVRWTGILHVVEVPLYVVALWLLLRRFGIAGAALAWTGRVIVDCVALFIMAVRLDSRLRRTAIRDVIIMLAVGFGALGVAQVIHATMPRIVLALMVAVPCGLALIASGRRVLGWQDRASTDKARA
jgi:O-antigen/teichoic acid export membrane protein